MDGEPLFEIVYQTLVQVCPRRGKRQQYSDATVLAVLLWAASWERPISWACGTDHLSRALRDRPMPSPSTVSRRLRQLSLRLTLLMAWQRLRDQLSRGELKFIDAKPLPVGGCSKDRDARWGYGTRTKMRGYKLYALVDAASGAFDQWRLGAMCDDERIVARQLLETNDIGAVTVGDRQYDSNQLYDRAGAREGQLIAPRRFRRSRGLGHHRHSPYRLASLAIVDSDEGDLLLHQRDAIERVFGRLTSCGGGLSSLPAWVRRPHRVANWLAAKLLLYHARLKQSQRLTA